VTWFEQFAACFFSAELLTVFFAIFFLIQISAENVGTQPHISCCLLTFCDNSANPDIGQTFFLSISSIKNKFGFGV